MSSTDHIRYDVLTSDAMRGIVRRVMSDAARQGLPGDHYFLITFLTQADGVKIPPLLLQQFPQEITIVLQHQFWDLVVTDDRFEVGLSFNGAPGRLTVPFSAVKTFLDPTVPFEIGFNSDEAVAAPEAPAAGAALAHASAPPQEIAADAKADGKPAEGAEVVRLDRFRKK